MPPPNCEFRIAQSRGEIGEMLSPYCGFFVVKGIARNFIEKYGERRLHAADIALAIAFYASSWGYGKRRRQTADFGLSVVFCAISLGNAVPNLWISRRH